MIRGLAGALWSAIVVALAGCASPAREAEPVAGSVQSNGVTLAYESRGEVDDPAIILVQGLGVSLTGWPQTLIDDLVRRGYRVVTFDNRDVGRSSKMDSLGDPDFAAIFGPPRPDGGPPPVPYTLRDMAADTVGLMDALNIESAHLVGASMGGQVAQLTAIHYPARVLSLTSIMTDTGNPQREVASAELFARLSAPPAPGLDFEGHIQREISNQRLTAGPAFPRTDSEYRTEIDRALAHAPAHPAGTARQLAAGFTAGDRRDALARLTIPVVVLHGDADPLVPVSNAREQAAVAPNAELVLIPGMGHEMPPAAGPAMAAAIAQAVERGERAVN